MRMTSHILILLSALSGSTLPKVAAAATSARLAVSAIVVTRCSIRVSRAANGSVQSASSCSDNSAPTIAVSAQSASAAKEAADKGTGDTGTAGADVTVIY